MTRVAIIGNSHVGALREADGAIRSAFPTLEIAYFALPRHRFNMATYTSDGILKANIPDDIERDTVLGINGMTEIDLCPFDYILIIGQGFLINGLYSLVAQFNILELAQTGHHRSISTSFLKEAVALRLGGAARRLVKSFGNDPRFVIAQMPFPSEEIDPTNNPNHTAAGQHPDAAQLAEIFATTLDEAMAQYAVGFLPAQTAFNTRPFQTQAQYARAKMLPAGQIPAEGDYSHMNSKYGFELFKAFTKKWLGLDPMTSPQTGKV